MVIKNNRSDNLKRLVSYSLIITGFVTGLSVACKKTAEVPSLVTVNVTDITSSSLVSGGLVYSTGGTPVARRGICVSLNNFPVTSDISSSDGTGPGSFTSSISGLKAGTTYHIRAYASNSTGTGYGNQYIITTPGDIPTITTTSASSVTSTTAVSGGEVLSDGGSTVTLRGICWSTSQYPTIDDHTTTDGSGVGIYSSSITGLTGGTKYYVRAYATNSTGTAYGNEISFISECNLPSAPGSITGITNVVPHSSGITYTIPAESGATSYNWTAPEGSIITSGQGTTSITINFGTTGGIISVSSINSCGESEKTELAISISIQNCGIVMDFEGNVYNTVTIGSQCWFVENLKSTRYRNGDPIFTETDINAWAALTIGAYCWYNNEETTYKAAYGALYNWYAVNDTRSICPTGWHVPTDGEWTVLENYLSINGYNYDNSIGGNKFALSLTTATGWNPSDIPGAVGNTDYPEKINITGFTGLPGGVRDANQLIYGSFGNYGMWWTSSEYNNSLAWDRGLATDFSSLGRLNVLKTHGFSIRCVKD
jgi:uncharacterized protein (TIGR02145 family)